MPVSYMRKLAYRGNSLYLQVPKALARQMRWQPNDFLIIEPTSTTSARVRRVEQSDLQQADMGPATLHASVAGGK